MLGLSFEIQGSIEIEISVVGQVLYVFSDACFQDFAISVPSSAQRASGENPC